MAAAEKYENDKMGYGFALIGLHLIMNNPVWFIFARLSNVVGGTGWHRSYLIDTTIRHFNEWWLVGTTYTAHWFIQHLPSNPNMIDITNQYIMEGVMGGIVKLGLFISIIAFSFRQVGLSIKAMEDKPIATKIMIWSTGVSLLGHAASYTSVCYLIR